MVKLESREVRAPFILSFITWVYNVAQTVEDTSQLCVEFITQEREVSVIQNL